MVKHHFNMQPVKIKSSGAKYSVKKNDSDEDLENYIKDGKFCFTLYLY